MKPLVTAVITTYKRDKKTVERALKSIVDQTYANIEIIIVNDYPDDKNLVEDISNMIKNYSVDRLIQYIVVDANGGACKARNIGASCAKGEYIAFLDDDDMWLPNKIERQVECALCNPKSSIIYCNMVAWTMETGEKREGKSKKPSGEIFYSVLGENIIGSNSFPLIRLSDFESVGGYREDMPALQDWELYLRLLKDSEATFIEEPLVVYTFHKGERISANPQKRIEAYEKMRAEFCNEIEVQKKAAHRFFLMGTYFYSLGGCYKESFAYLKKAIKCNPMAIKLNLISLLKVIVRKMIPQEYV